MQTPMQEYNSNVEEAEALLTDTRVNRNYEGAAELAVKRRKSMPFLHLRLLCVSWLHGKAVRPIAQR